MATEEERRKEREEDRRVWRDTQRQINELSARTLQMGDELRHAIDRLAGVYCGVSAIGQALPRPGA